MASKLFRAVVGFGIGLGATTAACFGATEGGTVGGIVTEEGKDASTETRRPGKTTYEDPPDAPPVPTEDASPDATASADAGIDAPKDVGADAFCDVPWPTTKGSKLPACSDPTGECADAGFAVACTTVSDAGACDWSESYAPVCVNGEWRCTPGKIRGDQCQR